MCNAWPETPIETVDTPRLRLRPLRADDAGRLAALADDPQIARMTSGLPSPYTRADAEAFLAAQADPLSPERIFAVDVRGDGLAGVLGFRPRQGCAWPELGYWLGRPFWRAGLATEAVRRPLAGRAPAGVAPWRQGISQITRRQAACWRRRASSTPASASLAPASPAEAASSPAA